MKKILLLAALAASIMSARAQNGTLSALAQNANGTVIAAAVTGGKFTKDATGFSVQVNVKNYIPSPGVLFSGPMQVSNLPDPTTTALAAAIVPFAPKIDPKATELVWTLIGNLKPGFDGTVAATWLVDGIRFSMSPQKFPLAPAAP